MLVGSPSTQAAGKFTTRWSGMGTRVTGGMMNVLISLGALGFVWVPQTFLWTYVAFAFFCLLICARAHSHVRPLFVFITLYLLIGLPNISAWRGYVTVDTVRMYSVCVWAVYLPVAFLSRKARFRGGGLRAGPAMSVVITVHLAVTFAVVAYIYLRYGNVLLNQHLRLGIPPLLGYISRSALPLAAVVPFMYTKPRVQLAIVSASCLPSILLGSRGTAAVALLSYALARVYASGWKLGGSRVISRRAGVIAAGLLGIVVVATGFFLRRPADGHLSTASQLVQTYFSVEGWWVYAILPLHIGFRETVGLSNTIMSFEPFTRGGGPPLFFADLFTLLPGEQIAAGQALGEMFGRVESGGLTPGLLGGTYIDFGYWSILIFLGIGLLLAWSIKRGLCDQKYIPIYVILLTQVIHLFHRGFIKPEYITAVAIAWAYVTVIRRIRVGVLS